MWLTDLYLNELDELRQTTDNNNATSENQTKLPGLKKDLTAGVRLKPDNNNDDRINNHNHHGCANNNNNNNK